MNTKMVDETLASSLDLYVDGVLAAAERDTLDERLSRSPELAAESARLKRLHSLIADSRIAVGEDFTAQVMAALPQPSAAKSAVQGAWRLPLAMMLFLTLAAALLLGTSLAENPLVGTGLAVLDFAQTTTLAGSGIVVATWRGAGMGLEEIIGASNMNLFAFATLVICLNLLFVSLWRRRRTATAVEES